MMTINLLPWRAEKRVNSYRRWLKVTLIGWLIMLCGIGLLKHICEERIQSQEKRIQRLNVEIASVKQRVKTLQRLLQRRQEVLKQIAIMQEVNLQRNQINHLFEQLSRELPPTIFLKKIEKKNNHLSLTGLTSSHIDIARLLQNLDKNIDFIHVNLIEVTKNEKYNAAYAEFKIKFDLQ